MIAKKPSDIAKEAFRLIAERKLQPTPEHYEAVYTEISGEKLVEAFPEEALRKIALALPAHELKLAKAVASIEQAITLHNWAAIKNSLLDYVTKVEHHNAEHTLAPTQTNQEVREQVARLIEHIKPALGDEDPRFNTQVQELIQLLRQPANEVAAVKTA